jgi:hypothetical protein
MVECQSINVNDKQNADFLFKRIIFGIISLSTLSKLITQAKSIQISFSLKFVIMHERNIFERKVSVYLFLVDLPTTASNVNL